ncbi:PspC domain-containing protein [Streptomyces sp. NPDC006879]|uniref:PspC domain-containing protein n=1 Tax=Streptomyces sp. NPDC006879 TaxID=3364767 RepID=UPI0036C57536
MTQPSDAPASRPDPAAGEPVPEQRPPLRRSRSSHVLSGVCGGLGRYFDLDPVIFRIVLGVLAVTGGMGLIFYGFAWLLIPLEGEEENEAKRLLTGRVEGATLAAILLALVGCGLFLSMLSNGSVTVFTTLVVLGLSGAAYWSLQRRQAAPGGGQDPAQAHGLPEAPPETKAPPAPGSPSWWRDPLEKGGPGGSGYLWGPASAAGAEAARTGPVEAGGNPWRPTEAEAADPPVVVRQPSGGMGGRVFLFALLAGGLGTSLTWRSQPLGVSLQTGLALALAVIGLGLVVGSRWGRVRLGTVVLGLVTALLMGLASVLPRDIGTDWARTEWRPSSVAALRDGYELGTGVATLDLSEVDLAPGQSAKVRVEVGAGRLLLVLPVGATAKADIHVGLGEVKLPGERHNGVLVRNDITQSATLTPPTGSPPGGTFELTLRTGVGQVEVRRAQS